MKLADLAVGWLSAVGVCVQLTWTMRISSSCPQTGGPFMQRKPAV